MGPNVLATVHDDRWTLRASYLAERSASETVTVLFTMTHDDASTQTTTYTATGTGTTVLTLAQLRALAKNNRSLEGHRGFRAKSSAERRKLDRDGRH